MKQKRRCFSPFLLSPSSRRAWIEISTQHPTYMLLIPEAQTFSYLVSNGMDVWTECYRRDETPDICPIISDFFDWLDAFGLMNVFKEHWKAL